MRSQPTAWPATTRMMRCTSRSTTASAASTQAPARPSCWRGRTARPPAAGGIDGLYLADRYLIGVQNGFGAGRVLRARLSTDGREIQRVEALESAVVDLNEPTTGTVTPGGFVYIANSQIWKWDADAESLRAGARLSPIMLRRVPLR